MALHGKNLIGRRASGMGEPTFQAVNPATGERLAPSFYEATQAEVHQALELTNEAFARYRSQSPDARAAFLRRIAEELEELGDELIERITSETALGAERLKGERARTANQLRMFAKLIEEGSWVDARIDRAIPDRKPLPKPDIRRMFIPIGPVAVFGASNFPLAFSVAGGDTASALAAGCPVVVKAHPAHPGTSEMVGKAILKAAAETGMPEGVFSLVHGRGHEVGLALVKHPYTKAVGFTGSLRGGRALFDAAATRPAPIPVYAEMGSSNPVFILPKALRERGEAIAKGLVQSVTMGVGQFCTKPGLVVGLDDDALRGFIDKAGTIVREVSPGTMLYSGICENFSRGLQLMQEIPGVQLVSRSSVKADPAKTEAGAAIFTTDADTFLQHSVLAEEVFGPATLMIRGRSSEELLAVAKSLEGHLTATLHGTEEELTDYSELIHTLENKVGRLIFNGYPTGIEVCPSIHHGGPYPATTNSHFTSVGTAAIYRFVRPVAYQDFPQSALPVELQNENRRGIWRLIDGELTRE